jgi:hypothetical protein
MKQLGEEIRDKESICNDERPYRYSFNIYLDFFYFLNPGSGNTYKWNLTHHMTLKQKTTLFRFGPQNNTLNLHSDFLRS